jgi:hypothetical protein
MNIEKAREVMTALLDIAEAATEVDGTGELMCNICVCSLEPKSMGHMTTCPVAALERILGD